MDTAERLALGALAAEIDPALVFRRSLRHRRIAYYGNADVSDTLAVVVNVLRNPGEPQALGFRYSIERQEDGTKICLSETIKAIPFEMPR